MKNSILFCYRCDKELHENYIYCSRCGARRSQNYQKEAMAFGSTLSEEEAIRYYLNVGYSYNVITVFLRIQTLKTRLRHDRLRREQIALDENIIRGIIEREI